MKTGQKLIKSEETKEKIYKSALGLFRKNGYQETTMREIASDAGIALGTTYYYFRSKDHLVAEFYEMTTSSLERVMAEEITRSKDFSTRFTGYIQNTLTEFLPYQKMVAVLVQNGVDPKNPNSPFSPETIKLRTRSIEIINKCIEGSNLKYDPSFKNHLPVFLWFFLMGMIFFWTFDSSKKQVRSKLLLTASLKIVILLLNVGRLPIINKVQSTAIKLLEDLWPLNQIYSPLFIFDKK